MRRNDLAETYSAYIVCLNRQDWENLGQFVHDEVRYNGEMLGLAGYRQMLEGDFQAIPIFTSASGSSSAIPRASPAACISTARRPVSCSICPSTANASASTRSIFYEFTDGKIERIWSITVQI